MNTDTGYDPGGGGRDKECLVSTTTTGLKRDPVNPVPVFRKKPQSPSPCLRFRNQGKNTVSSIIGGYKSVVTRNAHLLNPSFDWQYRFHDHIIRNDQEYQRINDYIENNPQKWYEDQFVNRTKKR